MLSACHQQNNSEMEFWRAKVRENKVSHELYLKYRNIVAILLLIKSKITRNKLHIAGIKI